MSQDIKDIPDLMSDFIHITVRKPLKINTGYNGAPYVHYEYSRTVSMKKIKFALRRLQSRDDRSYNNGLKYLLDTTEAIRNVMLDKEKVSEQLEAFKETSPLGYRTIWEYEKSCAIFKNILDYLDNRLVEEAMNLVICPVATPYASRILGLGL